MREFFDAVVKMRNAQKRYFKVRSATALTDAKESEDEVDRLIRLGPPGSPPVPKQRDLSFLDAIGPEGGLGKATSTVRTLP